MHTDSYLNRSPAKKMSNLSIHSWLNECACSEKLKTSYPRRFLSELSGILIISSSTPLPIPGRFSGLKRRLILSIDIIEGNFRRLSFFFESQQKCSRQDVYNFFHSI